MGRPLAARLNAPLSGKNDVYAIVRISETIHRRTVTLDESGATPVWNDGKGEELLFEVDAADTVCVRSMSSGTMEL